MQFHRVSILALYLSRLNISLLRQRKHFIGNFKSQRLDNITRAACWFPTDRRCFGTKALLGESNRTAVLEYYRMFCKFCNVNFTCPPLPSHHPTLCFSDCNHIITIEYVQHDKAFLYSMSTHCCLSPPTR